MKIAPQMGHGLGTLIPFQFGLSGPALLDCLLISCGGLTPIFDLKKQDLEQNFPLPPNMREGFSLKDWAHCLQRTAILPYLFMFFIGV
jgi:hypothetical protein